LNTLAAHLARWRARTEEALSARLPDEAIAPSQLHRAMRYATLAGGKRLRACLVYATGEALGADPTVLDVPACALELIHAYSLVHDDLPAMDDDALRRGKPTCHRAFDEATAILAGDALQTLAFQLLAQDPALAVADAARLRMIARLAEATGSLGMAGGQGIDLGSVGQTLDLATLQHMHALKTGALIRAAAALGALAAPKATPGDLEALDRYATHLGLLFQITDDILDVVGETATIGKPQGSDAARSKPTYPSLLGLAGARERALGHHQATLESLGRLGDNGHLLRTLADLVLNRDH